MAELPEQPVDNEHPLTAGLPDGLCASEATNTTQDLPAGNGLSDEQPTLHQTETCPDVSPLHAPTSVKENHAPDLSPSSSPILPNSGHEYGQIRRTNRPRKIVNSNSHADIFESTERPRLHRRKATGPSSHDTDIFSGMSAVALRALTSSNTTKNQTYWTAKLETEVVRKEGVRPESPTVKVKTIMQRREEEKARQRQERAERRARRSDDGFEFDDTAGILHNVDAVMADAASDSDDGVDYTMGTLLKHRRGPGDEEDYESPDRAERPSKRSRSGEEEFEEEKKRVKWDRALSTAVYVDDVKPRTRAHPRTDFVVKGCLATTAKASQRLLNAESLQTAHQGLLQAILLDNLGNLPNADAPLADLVHENIVVKKFVYDNDPEAEVAQPTSVLAPKNTRSRGKKSKTRTLN